MLFRTREKLKNIKKQGKIRPCNKIVSVISISFQYRAASVCEKNKYSFIDGSAFFIFMGTEKSDLIKF